MRTNRRKETLALMATAFLGFATSAHTANGQIDLAAPLVGNRPPLTPTITEPSTDGRMVNPADVHMETGAFSDPDAGDTHVCSDWEIWTVVTPELVWVTSCIGGVERLHTHLGDGVFTNSHAGRTELVYDTNYRLRTRHKDSSSDPGTEWSPWSERLFRTSSAVTNAPGTSGWAARQPGFTVEVVATNFQLPVNIAFVPNPGPHPSDPFFYVTELYGTIQVVTRDGTVGTYATNLLNFNPTGVFPGSGEQGLTGIVVDPSSGDVFAGMLYDAGGTHYPKVVRFRSNDGGLTAATQTTILSMSGEPQGQSHQISHFSMGPDNQLYVHMGDGFDSSAGQKTNSFRGKVLRMNLDGSPVTDNPFYNAANGTNAQDYIFAYGLRNPFGGDWRAADGVHYEVENGPSVDRFSKIERGRNYLYDGSDASMTNYAIYTWNPATGPVNLAFIQAQTFGGSGFPSNKMDHAFVTESGPTWASGPQMWGKRISEFVLDPQGNRLSGPTALIEYNGPGKATACGLAAGPDGLYFTDLYKDTNYTSAIERGANILRVRYMGVPPPPPAGIGDGLRGEYFDNADLSNPQLTRVDPTVDFDWGAGSPTPAIGDDTFSVRWTGQVQPQASETYTFYTVTDDGVRLWVDDQLLIDKWADQSATEWPGILTLRAYRRYNLRMEYFENSGAASARLLWSSPSTVKSVIPQTQLSSGTNLPSPFALQSIARMTNGHVQLTLVGQPGDIHRIEASTNLLNWMLLAKVTNILGTATFLDLFTNFPQRFYRMTDDTAFVPADIVIDNPAASIVGNWSLTSASAGAGLNHGADYRLKGQQGTGAAWVQYTPNIPVAGSYQVYEWHPNQGSPRTTAAPFVTTYNGGTVTNSVNLTIGAGQWNLVGTFNFATGTNGCVRITDAFPESGRTITADALKWVHVP